MEIFISRQKRTVEAAESVGIKEYVGRKAFQELPSFLG